MQRLLPPVAGNRKGSDLFPARSPGESSSSTLLGQILAGRYKILKVIDASTFKGHDLVLDQTVKIREELRPSQRDRDLCRQKARELILVRNPNFLNVIDLISDGSSDFVISEHPRGRLIAELLGERSPLGLDDVLALMRPLAHALDLIAASGIGTASFSARLVYTEAKRTFRCRPLERSQGALPQFNDSRSFSLKLDVWELVKPSKTSKAQKRGSKKLAVRRMALVAYDLLGGENHQAAEVEYCFQPIKRLGKAGNATLHRALEGSLFFKNAKGFLQKLPSAIRSHTSQRHTQGVEYWFQPIKRLGKAGNATLHRALEGSLFFKNAKGFLQKLPSAIRSHTSQKHTQGLEYCFQPIKRLGKAGNATLHRALEGSLFFKNAKGFLQKLPSTIRSHISQEHTQGLEYCFQPIKRLGKAGNATLHRALEGSLFFKNAKGFLQKLASAIRSHTSQGHTQGPETRINLMAYPGTNDVLRRFNRDTVFLVAGLLSSLFCATLLFSVLMPEFRNHVRSDSEEANTAKYNILVNAEDPGPFRGVRLKTKQSVNLEVATNNDQNVPETLAKEGLPNTRASSESTPLSAMLGTDISRNVASLNQNELSLRGPQGPASVIRGKIAHERSRSSGYSGTHDVKKQLIALWRKSLIQTEQRRSWTIFSTLSKKKKDAFITRTKP
jgi:hypothetical protein